MRFKRCHYCGGIVWPWQRYGWYTIAGEPFYMRSPRRYWHRRCVVLTDD